MKHSLVPIVSIDIPSGWAVDVDSNTTISDARQEWTPSMLISLTAPKEGCKAFKGIHHLVGRFMSAPQLKEYNLEELAALFKSSNQYVRIN
jgi:NAD(P)H-hydrate epimerase